MKTRKFLAGSSVIAIASCCLLYSSLATAAAEASSASAKASAAATAAPPAGLRPMPPAYSGGIRPRTAEDTRIEEKERTAQRTARSKGITALAKKDLAARRYKDALEKANLALELNSKNAEAARIKKKAEPHAGS